MAAVSFLFLLFLSLSLPIPSFSQSETDALLKLKQSFTKADALQNWVQGSAPCAQKWAGVMCSGDKIIGLHLTKLGISGKLDADALLGIATLKTIGLMDNAFSGPIPDFNKLPNLKGVYLSNNQFIGEIPNDFFKSMLSLKKLYLNNNSFTGKIPESVMQLPLLAELHVEGNQFSGQIPASKFPEKLKDVDFSSNKLEGTIPESFSKFDPKFFQGNEGLCGKPLNKNCAGAHVVADPSEGSSKGNQKAIIGGAVLIVMLFFVGAAVLTAKQKDDDFSVLGREKEPLNEESVSVQMQESTRKQKFDSGSGSSRRGGGSKKGSSHGGRNGTMDLVMVNDEKGAFGMQDLMKAQAEVLGNGGLGSAYKAVMGNGLAVVVKRMREMNKLSREAFEAEMRRLGGLKHPNLLMPLAYNFRREEKLMVTEYMPKGSLLYVLHGDRGTIHADLNWPIRLNIIRGIASGLSFIHTNFSSYEVPHGNLKSSNVLLTEEYKPLLSDYGLHALANPNNVAQALFAYKCPEYGEGQCISPKADVYCLGIIILEILTGKFPSQYLSNGKGGIDVVQWVQTLISEDKEEELIDPEIVSDSNSLGQMLQLIHIGVACTKSNPGERPDMREAIRRIEEVINENLI